LPPGIPPPALNKLKINNLVKPKSRLPYTPGPPEGGVLKELII
jgi:hypothetical protein